MQIYESMPKYESDSWTGEMTTVDTLRALNFIFEWINNIRYFLSAFQKPYQIINF